MNELFRCTPDGRNLGKYQFLTAYTGGGAGMYVHLTFDDVQERLRERFGDPTGTLTDDGTELIFHGNESSECQAIYQGEGI